MSQAMAQLTLFAEASRAEPVAVTKEVAPEIPEVLEGQFSLFEGVSARCALLAGLAREARFDEAVIEAERAMAPFEEAAPWRLALEEAAAAVRSHHGDPDRLAGVALEWRNPPEEQVPAGLSWAIRRGLHLAIAQAAEQSGPGAVVAGRPAGWHWMQAGRVEEARRSLEATSMRGECVAEALTLSGNLAHAAGEIARARECYRRACLVAPGEVRIEDVADEAVRNLADECEELELRPPVAWVPLVGLAAGVFSGVAELSVVEPVARFQQAVQRSRAASARGAPDMDARREMKSRAPGLFERLRDARLI